MARKTNVSTSDSFRKASQRVEAWANQTGRGLGPSLRIAGEEIMTDVKASRAGHGVPVDTGALRSSGRVEGPSGGRKPKVELTFGGAAAPYALEQHERMDFRHKIGEPRYLVRGVERFAFDGSRAREALKKNSEDAAKAQSKRQ